MNAETAHSELLRGPRSEEGTKRWRLLSAHSAFYRRLFLGVCGARLSEARVDLIDLRELSVPERLRFHALQILARVTETGPDVLLVTKQALLLRSAPDVQEIRIFAAAEDPV